MDYKELFQNKRNLVTIITILIIALIGVNTFLFYLWKSQAPAPTPTPTPYPSEYPYDYDVTTQGAVFVIKGVNLEKGMLDLEFFLPKNKTFKTITSKLECPDNDTKIVYQPNLAKQDREKMNQELNELYSSLLQQTGYSNEFNNLFSQKRYEIMQKYGYRIEGPNSNLLEIIANNLNQNKQLTLYAKCLNNLCFTINKDCQLFIR